MDSLSREKCLSGHRACRATSNRLDSAVKVYSSVPSTYVHAACNEVSVVDWIKLDWITLSPSLRLSAWILLPAGLSHRIYSCIFNWSREADLRALC